VVCWGDNTYGQTTVPVCLNLISASVCQPLVGAITAPVVPVQINTPITASASFTEPGTLDTHTAVFNWGDGTSSTATVTEASGSGTASGTHIYTTAGVYTITLTVTDQNGVTGQSVFGFVVVYDCAASSAISSNFNGTSIPGGSYIWFNAVLDLKGRNGPASVQFGASNIQFAGFTVNVPAAVINFSASATTDMTVWDAPSASWVTTVPVGYQGKVFLSGTVFMVPTGGLPGGINPVTWSGSFVSATQGLKYQWQWGAAVYTMFGANGSVPIKAIDGTHGTYPNSDHAGTPENFKSYVTGGATGGGGSNWTGSYSGTASAECK
jgi:PKD domain